jgi:hypothetical protein
LRSDTFAMNLNTPRPCFRANPVAAICAFIAIAECHLPYLGKSFERLQVEAFALHHRA